MWPSQALSEPGLGEYGAALAWHRDWVTDAWVCAPNTSTGLKSLTDKDSNAGATPHFPWGKSLPLQSLAFLAVTRVKSSLWIVRDQYAKACGILERGPSHGAQ